ncbi:glycosyltransferase family 2 protein [Deinococcus aquiradiocola]|uniref:Glycosyl transferase n=1 Tax=Deinococcus aquiradiocola TaxID=393059 RepID=A0A917PFY8_9DEIO|nr:glycosyltransferase family 2 protein [Deinococcus aquiradiocola]GGJ75766.1 glycosyl transferase [Deinococcus aquiradiocola]
MTHTPHTDPPTSLPQLLTVVIVSYGSRPDLERCLPTLVQHPDHTPRILVIDNHGHDGVAEWLTQRWPQVTVLRNPANTGYAGGNNLGLAHTSTPYALILNPDTEVSPGALSLLLRTAITYPDAFITPKLVQPDGRVNACGNEMHYTGLTWCLGLGEAPTAYGGLHTVPLLSGAAILARTSSFVELGGFDEQYFMYHEDTDLSLRARLLGYRLLCQADASVTHHYTLGMTPRKLHYLERNRLLTLFKTLSASTLVQLLPALLLTELATWAYAVRSAEYARQRFRVYVWLWQQAPGIRRARREVQRRRTCSDADLLDGAALTLPFAQLTGGLASRALNAVTTPVYALLRPLSLRRHA